MRIIFFWLLECFINVQVSGKKQNLRLFGILLICYPRFWKFKAMRGSSLRFDSLNSRCVRWLLQPYALGPMSFSSLRDKFTFKTKQMQNNKLHEIDCLARFTRSIASLHTNENIRQTRRYKRTNYWQPVSPRGVLTHYKDHRGPRSGRHYFQNVSLHTMKISAAQSLITITF